MSEDQDQGGQQPVDDDGSVRFNPPITSTTHILPFERLSPLDFERLCLWLVEREGYTHAEHLGLAGSEQGRDVIAYKPTSQGEELWYFQCKRYRSIRAKTLKDEVDKYLELAQEKPHLKPFGVVFVVSCAVSADAREEVGAYCEQHNLASEFWALTELDLRVKRHTDLLREFFGLYPRPIGGPFQAPPLPAHFVPRPEVSEALKARLLADEPAAPGVLVVSAIHGLGGIGKSVLAAALAHNPEVQAHFPDGVLWAILGQQPEILSLLSGWIQTLGDYDFHPTTVEAASAHLRTLLHDKAALLVVDDVWGPDHAVPFQVGGPRCQVLITTRRADVADEVGADLYQLDVMTPQQSLDLLSARLGRALEGMEREEALLLAEAVGYLPLALELTATRVVRGMPWNILWDALEEEIVRLEVLEGPRRRRKVRPRLEASFNLSLNALRIEDEAAWRAFVWLGILPEDVAVAAPMASTLWEVKEEQATNLLELLWNDALLLPGLPVRVGEGIWPAYRLHDLLHDMARCLLIEDPPQGLGLDLPTAHATLLERYHKCTQDSLWHTLPDDGYIHAHLTWHMEQAGQVEEIHTLLQEETAQGQNGWYQARERLGQATGYLKDVTRAWLMAEKEFAIHHSSFTIGLQCRYALITASVSSLIGNIPLALLTELVTNGLWTPSQALAAARQNPDMLVKIKALGTIANYLPETERLSVLHEALAMARALPELDRRGKSPQLKALAALVPHLPKAEQRSVLQAALRIAQALPERDAFRQSPRAEALILLAPHLPRPVLREALVAVRMIREGYERAVALSALAPHLHKDDQLSVLREALSAWAAIGAEYWRGKALAELVSHLAETGYLYEALEVARTADNTNYRAEVLASLAPHLPETERLTVLRKALRAARAPNAARRNQTLAALVPHLAEAGYPYWAMEIARTIHHAGDRAEALIGLVPHLPKPERLPVLREAINITRAINDTIYWAWTLEALIPHVPEAERLPVLRAALDVARATKNVIERTQALATLAPYLPETERLPVLDEVLRTAWTFEGEPLQVGLLGFALEKLGPHLPETMWRETLHKAWGIEDKYSRARTLTVLAPYLPETEQLPVLREALDTARAIEDAHTQAVALLELALHLPEHLLREALDTAQAIEWEDDRSRALSVLVLRLAELGYPHEALEITQRIGDYPPQHWGARALAALAPYLSLPLVHEALAVARAWPGRELLGTWFNFRALALSALALRLAELGYPFEAMDATRAIEREEDRLAALAVLVPYLPEAERMSMLHETLDAARAIKIAEYRAQILADLAPHLPETTQLSVLCEALDTAPTIGDLGSRLEVLRKLAPYLAQQASANLYSCWHATLHVVAARTRKDLLYDLQGLVPVISALGGAKAVVETFRAVQDVGRWWS